MWSCVLWWRGYHTLSIYTSDVNKSTNSHASILKTRFLNPPTLLDLQRQKKKTSYCFPSDESNIHYWKVNYHIDMQVAFEFEKVFGLKHWSIKSYSSPSSSVILPDGAENFLTRPWSPFRFNLSLSDVCVGVFCMRVRVFPRSPFVCAALTYAYIYISICLFASVHVNACVSWVQ